MRRATARPGENTKPSLALTEYAGTYVDELYGHMVITEEGGQLALQIGGR